MWILVIVFNGWLPTLMKCYRMVYSHVFMMVFLARVQPNLFPFSVFPQLPHAKPGKKSARQPGRAVIFTHTLAATDVEVTESVIQSDIFGTPDIMDHYELANYEYDDDYEGLNMNEMYIHEMDLQYDHALETTLAFVEPIDYGRQYAQIEVDLQLDHMHSPLVHLSEVETNGRQLGRGAEAIVSKGKWRNNAVAVKRFISEEDTKAARREIEIHSQLRPHPNLVQYYGTTISEGGLCMVMEVCDGSLDKLVTLHLLNPRFCLKILKGAAAGLKHLHNEGVIHRDIAARNILICGETAKISDLGLSQMENKKPHHHAIFPIRHSAPEVLSSKARCFSRQSDLWSFGILMWEMFSGERPYPYRSNAEIINVVVRNGNCLQKPNIRIRGVQNTLPDEEKRRLPTEAKSLWKRLKPLYRKCTAYTPEERPTDFGEVLEGLMSIHL
ncbi:tyrosine-protein kinase ITK/TSK isoform 2 [Planoprotostelium fungivorum]|uniref:Tyrosine-protein kinase ITK/TSK isoform 2 n=1 Tax=Planoprotostelium fungivorum TaxID=1890364 RepID=A0A2P6MZ58_9EUKA|nr:tyrosine-protein kinase ITK/TSK isoform 2 [Planoprotostelium fungivorum]